LLMLFQFGAVDSIRRDIIFGVRGLARNPGFAFVCVVTLAIGIGGNSAVFSIVNGTILNSIPWENPDRIYLMEEANLRQGTKSRGVSPGKFLDWRKRLQSFSGLVAADGGGIGLTDGGNLELVPGASITTNAFSTLGIRPLLGRALDIADGEPGADPAAMISEGLWQRRYGGDPNIVGSTIELDGIPTVLVGVSRANEWFPWPWTDVLVPLDLGGLEGSRSERQLIVVGILARGSTPERATVELERVGSNLAELYPQTDAGWAPQIELARERVLSSDHRLGVFVLMITVGAVLLIACANVANLLLARAASRTKEMATRAAVGATRAQIIFQLMSESVVLAILSVGPALLLTRWALDFFLSIPPENRSYLRHFMRLDLSVVGFTAGVGVLTVLIFGLVPALRASKVDLNQDLKDGGRTSGAGGSRTIRASLTVVQIACATALVLEAGLLVRAFNEIHTIDFGFDPNGLAYVSLKLPESRYPEASHQRDFHANLLSRLETLPHVSAIGSTRVFPISRAGRWKKFEIRGGDETASNEAPAAVVVPVSHGYFETLRLPVLVGREFEIGDRSTSAPVVIVNETLAERFFPNGDAVTRMITLEGGQPAEIIGVVADINYVGLGAKNSPKVYAAYDQRPTDFMNILIRTDRDPFSLAVPVREEIRRLDPRLATVSLDSVTANINRTIWHPRFFVTVMSSLAVAALLLASVGVYGVINYSTSQRTQEFGVRSAVGATPLQIATMVLQEAASLGGAGLLAGTALAVGLGRVVSTFVYGVDAWHTPTFLGVCLSLFLVTQVAALVPAIRASRADPTEALRSD
jgi:putative ABC transport system permease protein